MRTLTEHDVVVITGNNGLLGTAVVTKLGARGDRDADGHPELRRFVPRLVGLDRDGQPQPPPYCECIVFDVTKPDSVELGLKRLKWEYGHHIAGFIHLAAYYDFSGKPSPLYEKVTVEGTRNVLRGLRAQKFEVDRFVFSSTMLVHRAGKPGETIDESAPLEADWPYPESKIATEQVLAEDRGSYPVTSLRIAGVYTDRCESIPLSHQIQRIREKSLKSHLYAADPAAGQSFVHVDDATDALIAAVERSDEQPDLASYLIGEPDTYSYAELQDRIGELLHGKDQWKTLRVPAPMAKAGAAVQTAAAKLPGVGEPFIKPWMIDHAGDHYHLDISAAQRDLGWSPKHRLIDTLPKMIQTLQHDPAEWHAAHDLEHAEDASPEQAAR